ncbi:polysaccharide deacetylase family protein [Flavivirga aquimarina]|uniref:Polysaccharide deacetylase family protein n=1 Tax=Flavivirga aquimarina TaxID=2027862 RepID=A0ABT8WF53_9FLAO|nr:polysaccharide deacetylase family protein [Flavivirga aquimarina]MDO5971746.1 polysaccharide deacetylase family protein [Flavivirga aquimarina]
MLNYKSVNIITIIVLLVFLFTSYFYKLPLWSLLILVFIWLLITAAGSFFITWNYHLKSLHSNKQIKENRIAITFDDGPHPEFTPKVLELLKKYNAKATFFCIGKHIEAYPNVFSDIIKQGHTVGNHTYTHANNFGFFKTKEVIDELQKTNAIVKNIVGFTMQLYRPAFGVTNPRIKKAIKHTELQSIGWNIRSLDTTSRTSKTVFNRVTKDLSRGDVILLHDTSLKTITVLERLLLFLQKQNMESVTIDSLFNIKAYA